MLCLRYRGARGKEFSSKRRTEREVRNMRREKGTGTKKEEIKEYQIDCPCAQENLATADRLKGSVKTILGRSSREHDQEIGKRRT